MTSTQTTPAAATPTSKTRKRAASREGQPQKAGWFARIVVFILCFLYPLIAAILVYLRHNVNALSMLQIDVVELLPIDASFFRTFMEVQGIFSFLLAVLAAPPNRSSRDFWVLKRHLPANAWRLAAVCATALPDIVSAKTATAAAMRDL